MMQSPEMSLYHCSKSSETHLVIVLSLSSMNMKRKTSHCTHWCLFSIHQLTLSLTTQARPHAFKMPLCAGETSHPRQCLKKCFTASAFLLQFAWHSTNYVLVMESVCLCAKTVLFSLLYIPHKDVSEWETISVEKIRALPPNFLCWLPTHNSKQINHIYDL